MRDSRTIVKAPRSGRRANFQSAPPNRAWDRSFQKSQRLSRLNLLLPTIVTTVFVKWALAGIGILQLSTLFMQMRGGAPGAAMAGPVVLLVLAVIYWFIRT